MSERKNFIRKETEEGWVICEDVHLPSGCRCTVFISPKSVYVLSEGRSAPIKRYRELQEILGAVYIRLYVLDTGDGIAGVYDDLKDALGGALDEEDLNENVCTWLSTGRVIFSQTAIGQMVDRLKSADMKARGYVVQEGGEVFLLRHGTLKKASPVSSDLLYYVTLFGGTLGFHRFALGRFFSGLFYLFTGGLFLFGWLMDLLQLFLGAQKDKKKRYLFPLTNRWVKLLILPLGLVTGFFLFGVYLRVLEVFGYSFQLFTSQQIQSADPEAIRGFMDFLLRLNSR